MKGYTIYGVEAGGFHALHNETGMIFVGFKSTADAERRIPLIEDDLNLGGPETCGCGCGEILGAGARFRPGHDAKLKSQLMQDARAGKPIAIQKLRAFGWLKFLKPEVLDALGIGHEEVWE